jgi:hypothetical protein
METIDLDSGIHVAFDGSGRKDRRQLLNDQLFRVVVDYASDRTEGMTDDDMIEAIGVVYGTPVQRVPGAGRLATRVDTESGTPVLAPHRRDAVRSVRSSSAEKTVATM